ncbi:MAG TPA: Rossmann-like and DUF2520 domain-containing protein [Bryobacteraceae bacterium]
MSAREPIGVAGTGRMAQALGRLLAEAGEPVAAIAGRDAGRTAAAAVFIGHGAEAIALDALPSRARRILVAVSDDAVSEVALRMARAGMHSGVSLHTCGARGVEALAPLAEAGVSCGVLHPLQTVAGAEQGATALRGSWFAVSGDDEAAAWGRQICALAGGKPLRIDPDRMPLYHAAAVMASNYVTGLLDAAVMLMRTAGVGERTALDALGPLVRVGVENTLASGAANALTGPICRGDVETVRRHLASLADAPRPVRALYRSAGLYVLELARRSGLAAPQAREIEALLREGQ